MGWGTSLGGDYYDAEYYAQEAAKKISISTIPTTWCDISITGNILIWTTGNCPIVK